MRKRIKNIPEPLAWDTESGFKCSTYYKELAPYILQQDHKFMELRDIPHLDSFEDRLFFRPDDNVKSFTGQVVDKKFWNTWPRYLMDYNYLAGSLSVVAAPVKRIDYEWRLLIVDKKVVAGSQYKSGETTIDIQEGYPVECKEFAEEVASHWSPEPVYILDVGLCEAKYVVVEIGPFNYAGLYKMDLRKVVDSINERTLNSAGQ